MLPVFKSIPTEILEWHIRRMLGSRKWNELHGTKINNAVVSRSCIGIQLDLVCAYQENQRPMAHNIQ